TGRRLPASANPLFNVHGLRFADHGKRLVGVSEELIVWDPATGKELRRFPKLPRQISPRLALSLDESLIAGHDPELKKVIIWEAATGKELHRLEGLWPRPITFSPDNRRLIAGSERGLSVWDVKSGKLLHELGKNQEHYSGTMSPDGKWLASWSESNREHVIH